MTTVAMTTEIKKTRPQNKPEALSDLLKAHFRNPLLPVRGAAAEKIRELARFPLRDKDAKGGLTLLGKAWVENAGIHATEKTEILRLAAQHAERARIDIGAVIMTCWLFSQSKKRDLTPPEAQALKNGIHLSDQLGTMQTVKKNGRLLTDDFTEMMTRLHRALKKDNSEIGASLERNPHWAVLKKAAALQTKTKEEDKRAAAPSLAVS